MSDSAAVSAAETGAEEDRRLLAGGTASSTAGIVSFFVAVAIVGVINARVLGPTDYGGLAIAWLTSYLVPAIAGLGLAQGVGYFVGRGEWPADDLVRGLRRASIVRGLAGAAVMLGLYALASESLFAGLTWTMAIAVAASVPFSIAWRLCTTAALASGRFSAAAKLEMLPAVCIVTLVPAGVLLGGKEGATIAVAGVHAISGVVAMTWLHAHARGVAGAGERGVAPAAAPGSLRAAGRYGMRGWLGEGLQVTSLRFDLFFINVLATNADVAVYTVALSLAQIAWIMPQGIANAVLPSAAGVHARGGAERYGALTAAAVRHATALAPPVAVLIAILLIAGVPILYGEDFSETVGLGFILLPGSLLLGLGRVMLAAVIARGHARWALWIAAATVPVAVAGYLLLIPALGAKGAAISSSAAYALTGVLAAIAFRRATGLGLRTLLPTRELTADYRALATIGRREVGRVLAAGRPGR